MQIKSDALQVRETDKAFTDSPDAGHPACLCSRCGGKIGPNEMPIRMWPQPGDRSYNPNEDIEYRYCQQCMTGVAFFNCRYDMEFGSSSCKGQCDECKALEKEGVFNN